MGTKVGKLLLLAAAIGLTSCTSKSLREDECKVGSVCTIASQYESYLDLRVVNMTKRPIKLPLLHGIGGGESPGVFLMDFAESDVAASPGPNPPSLGRWEIITLYPNEGVSLSLPWEDYQDMYEHASGCREITANFIINAWARQGVYYEGPIVPSKRRICMPHSAHEK
jgi:hypothetical protein